MTDLPLVPARAAATTAERRAPTLPDHDEMLRRLYTSIRSVRLRVDRSREIIARSRSLQVALGQRRAVAR